MNILHGFQEYIFSEAYKKACGKSIFLCVFRLPPLVPTTCYWGPTSLLPGATRPSVGTSSKTTATLSVSQGEHRPSHQMVQSRPIEMGATILYLANRWTEFEMLWTPHRFLYLVMFSLLAFPSIPQFIAHFWQISSFLCIVLPFSNSYRNESCSKACSAHFATAATLFFFLLLKEQNGGAKKVLKS